MSFDIIKPYRELGILLLAVFALHSVFIVIPPLNGDEALFWEWSRHLALGYYSHPPMTAWAIAAVDSVFGTSKYTIRLTALILHILTLMIVFRMAKDLKRDGRFALVCCVIYALMPISVILGSLITTDCSLIFFWASAAYCTKKAVIDDRKWYWGGAGIAAGGMLLTKFLSFPFFPSVFLFLIFSSKYRKQLLTIYPYLSFLLAIIITGPFLYWNSENNWLTFQFNFVARHGNIGFEWQKPFIYLGGQLLSASPVFFSAILVAGVLFVGSGLTGKIASNRGGSSRDGVIFYSWLVMVPIVFFFLQSFVVRIGAHWPGAIYSVAAVVLGAWLYQCGGMTIHATIRKVRLYWIGIGGTLLVSIPLAAVAIQPKLLPDRYIYTSPIDRKQPIGAQYFGWVEVGQRIAELRDKWESRPEGFFLSTNNYAVASLLDFYTPGFADFVFVGHTLDKLHGKEFLMWENGRKKLGANTIYVVDRPLKRRTRQMLSRYFEEIRELPNLEIKDESGRILRIFYFTLGLKYKGGEPPNLSLW